MKNYLFTPFKNDDEKISSFSCLKNMIVNDDACGDYLANELVMFIGRLESYYDVMINDKEKGWIELCIRKVDREFHQSEVKRLKAELDKVRKGNIDTILTMNVDNEKLNADNNDLKIELELLQGGDEQGVISSNQLQVDRLNADNDKLLEYNNRLLAEIEELKAEIRLDEGVILARNKEVDELKAENNKHYPKEYKDEARDYFHHNPQCKKLLFFMIDGNDFDDDGCYNAYLLDDECIAEIDNV